MRNAVAVWNYCRDAVELPRWINEFAYHGFDAISFHPDQFASDTSTRIGTVVKLLRARDLAATVHGYVGMDRRLVRTMVETMGDRLKAFTIDRAVTEDSRGKFYDAGRMASELSYLQQLTRGTDIRLGIEDFPLDRLAMDHFAADLGNVYDDLRTGILIDVGHMHMRMNGSEYFSGLSVAEYFSRLPCPVIEMHLHDNNGKEDEHGHFGLGTVPFAEIADALKEMEFDGVCTIEVVPEFHGSTPEESKSRAVESLNTWRDLMQGKR